MKLPAHLQFPQWSTANNERMALAFAVRDFTRYRFFAKEARERKAITTARDWAAQARKAWADICRLLTPIP